MRNLSRLTLTAALLGTMALPALAQGHAVNGAAPVVTRHHRVVKPSRPLHHIAATSTNAVRTPAVTGTTLDAKPGLDIKPGLDAKPGLDIKPGTVRTPAATAAAPLMAVPSTTAPLTTAPLTTAPVTTPAPRIATQAPVVPGAVKPN